MSKCIFCGRSGLTLKVDENRRCPDCARRFYEQKISETVANSKNDIANITHQLDYWKSKYEELDASITPEMRTAFGLKQHLSELNADIDRRNMEIESAANKLAALNKQILVAEDTIEMESFSLYRPTYNFTTSAEYKERLDEVRQRQKDMLKSGDAAKCSTKWTVNGSKTEGAKQTKNNIKLFLRAFNVECESAIRDAKFNNFDRCTQRIEKSFEQINDLGQANTIYINHSYLNLKMEELRLAYEYAQKKQQEKDEQAEIRRQQREQAKLDKEIAEARKAAEKERQHFEQALSNINAQIAACTDAERRAELETRRTEIRDGLDSVNGKLEDIDYRQTNQRAGYVYIISNIGAFGENVYKIGMTRRLDPMDRIDELGDASVPFYFDVHAMIFSEDAPALEAALHRAFENKRINKVNSRREYFRVTLDEIKAVVRANHDKSVEFIDVPAAEQYRESLRM